MRNKNYYSNSWGEFFLTWAIVFAGGGLGLVAFGLVFKLMWRVFMFGWELV